MKDADAKRLKYLCLPVLLGLLVLWALFGPFRTGEPNAELSRTVKEVVKEAVAVDRTARRTGLAGSEQNHVRSGTMDWIIDEDFSAGMENWWVEGGESVAVEDGRLVMRADNPDVPGGKVCTVWCRTPHPADFVLELDAQIIGSSIDANNINLFFCFSDPGGQALYETRASRNSGAYKLYHGLSGNIITFLKERPPEGARPEDPTATARVRIRHCPGFKLLAEAFRGHCRQGEPYHIVVTKRGGDIAFAVNGRELLRVRDPEPCGPGLLGLRTFRTELWWDNVRLRAVD